MHLQLLPTTIYNYYTAKTTIWLSPLAQFLLKQNIILHFAHQNTSNSGDDIMMKRSFS